MSLIPVTIDTTLLPGLLLADAKQHLRVDADDDDMLIAGMIARSIAEWEAMSDGVKINPGQWAWEPSSGEFDANGMARIPITPITSLAVKAADPANPAGPPVTVTGDYAVVTDYSSGAIRWTISGAWQAGLVATIDSGYADPDLIPPDLRGHLFEWVTRYYEQRSVLDGAGLETLPGWKDFAFAPYWNPKA